jgi:hypothetical protein
MMRFICSILLLSLVAAAGCRNSNPEEKKTKGFELMKSEQLFNGRDLDGWEHVGKGGFVVENGQLKTEGGMGLLWYTREKFGNCLLRAVYMTTAEDSNSGIFIRIAERPADEWFAVHHGYEVQICDKEEDFHTTGAVYSFSKVIARSARPTGEWNVMEIELRGPLVIVRLNGTKVNEFDPAQDVPERKQNWEPERGPRPESGYIGLQNHHEGSTVCFKEVSISPL